jgi:hypothetical protein
MAMSGNGHEDDAGHARHHFGAHDMPFDLQRTLHIFTPTAYGGMQDVVSTDEDAHQIALIRQHLSTQAALRAQGDYSVPAHMHGPSMPGLASLSGEAGHIQVRYEALPAGGRISYVSHDPVLIRAIHDWFKAQMHDHGQDAMMSHQ